MGGQRSGDGRARAFTRRPLPFRVEQVADGWYELAINSMTGACGSYSD